MIALGGLYTILPEISGRPLYSRFLADLQYWLILIGVSGFAIILTISGLIQGNAWLNGETVYRVLPEIHMYYIVRAGLGLMIFTAALIGLYNMGKTLFSQKGGMP
jgi:cytochrome c oxidase cbb3-type subunit 1/cytochrome c oxidase cbb3-type subunit I/II